MATVPVVIALLVITAWDVAPPDPRSARASALVFAAGVALFALLSVGVVGDVLDDLRGARDVLIIR